MFSKRVQKGLLAGSKVKVQPPPTSNEYHFIPNMDGSRQNSHLLRSCRTPISIYAILQTSNCHPSHSRINTTITKHSLKNKREDNVGKEEEGEREGLILLSIRPCYIIIRLCLPDWQQQFQNLSTKLRSSMTAQISRLWQPTSGNVRLCLCKERARLLHHFT